MQEQTVMTKMTKDSSTTISITNYRVSPFDLSVPEPFAAMVEGRDDVI